MTGKPAQYIFRYTVFFIGIFFMALGIVLTIKAALGTTPISALPYVASLGFVPSLGFFTMLMNMGLIAMQVLILRDKFPKLQYLQIPASLLFGVFIDFWMAAVPEPAGHTYAGQLLYLGAGTLVLAFGIFVEVSANVVMMAGEGAVMVLSLVTRRDFGTLKVVFDSTLVLLAGLLSLLLFQEFRGIREGTLVSALLVGCIVKLFFAVWKKMRHQGEVS